MDIPLPSMQRYCNVLDYCMYCLVVVTLAPRSDYSIPIAGCSVFWEGNLITDAGVGYLKTSKCMFVFYKT